MANILLHACCGPCSLEPTRLLLEEGHDLAIYFFNPNIHPAEEYQLRVDALLWWANQNGVKVIEGEWDPRAWEQTVGKLQREGCEKSERCRACYRMRLEATAKKAVELGFDALSSTLNVSPDQFNDIIHEETDRAAEAAGLESVFRDFRPYYPEASRRSRDMGMYRQHYCGCHYSKVEAETEQEERRLIREEKKAARLAATAEREAAEAPAREQRKAEQKKYDAKQRAKRAARDAARRAAKEAAKNDSGN